MGYLNPIEGAALKFLAGLKDRTAVEDGVVAILGHASECVLCARGKTGCRKGAALLLMTKASGPVRKPRALARVC